MNKHSQAIKHSIHGDEYYSPQNVVDMIIPYIKNSKYKTIWCPFDKEESLFVQTFSRLGYEVVYGHIETGEDFLLYDEPQGDIVVSNPPFSIRDKIFEKLYLWDLPFALVMNSNGLFDSRKRHELFKKHPIQMLIPKGRMRFYHKDNGIMNQPNFQSIYIFAIIC